MASKKEVMPVTDDFDLDQTLALLSELGIHVSDVRDASEEIGDGWRVLKDKDELINVPFVIVDYRFSDGKFKDPETGESRQFAILRVVTREAVESGGKSGKWIVTDGSTGIMRQMGEWVTKQQIDLSADKVPALVCTKGLTRSDYEGPAGDASTYYIAL